MIPVKLYQAGFTQLVSVIPPNASLSPKSKISATELGKTPGVKYRDGSWGGYKWLTHEPTEAEIREWTSAGANIGILAAQWPAVDIDVTDPVLAGQLVRRMQELLGPAPVRIGREPKALLMYRLATGAEPFGRVALRINDGERHHLLEVLGAGRQYLIRGTHPSGKPYRWDRDLSTLTPYQLTPVTFAHVETALETVLEELGLLYDVGRLGTGATERTATDQAELLAPSADELTRAVGCIPNDDTTAPDRESYIKMGYAIRAAGQMLPDEGESIFLEWAGRAQSERVEGNPETPRSDWRRMAGPYALGWPWIAELARRQGFNMAATEFTAVETEPAGPEDDAPPSMSDQWLAQRVVEEHGDSIRVVPLWNRFQVWDGSKWANDELNATAHRTGLTLKRLAAPLLRVGGSKQETKAAQAEAKRLCSATTRDNVLKFVRTDTRLSVIPTVFDTDPWILNTPAGVVDLHTGELLPHDPARLLTKITAVGPDRQAEAPEWRRFLAEATGGDIELERYLQKAAGYCLTGETTEQVLFFLWGPGGRGKSTFLNAISQVMGDYAVQAPTSTFAASRWGEAHPTELAGLHGARLVAASETASGQQWNEVRVKSLTGGEPVRARFMHKDFFTYRPQFKLFFAGNFQPEIRNLESAMRRRIHLVPFIVAPAERDLHLEDKLRAEAPAILAWMIEGCLRWQLEGLTMPAQAQETTDDYLGDEDAIGQWLEEYCDEDPLHIEYSSALFDSWRQWANANGEPVGSTKRLVQSLKARGLKHVRHTAGRGFYGYRIKSILEEV